jgi:hypothetical protein
MERDRYFRMNFTALRFGEIFRTNPALFILLFPVLAPIMLILKLFRITALTGVPMPMDIRLGPVGPNDWVRSQKGLPDFEDSVAKLSFEPMGVYLIENFTQPCYLMAAIDKSRTVYGVWYLSMVGGQVQVWIDMASKMVSGESITSSTSPSAGAVRMRPGTTILKLSGADPKRLYEFHLEKIRGKDVRTRKPEEFADDFCDGWRKTFGYYIETGLYLPV